jgi:MEMO1 family protein
VLSSRVRPPAVAGMFYPSGADELFEAVHRSFTHPLGPGKFPQKGTKIQTSRVECLIVPHAGYEYSGPVAAHSYNVAWSFFTQNADKPVTVFIFGPNHYGIGSGVAVSPSEFWGTPLGEVKVDTELSKRIAKSTDIIDLDGIAHSREHSIEVQLPFLQVVSEMKKDLSIVPISFMLQDYETTKQVAEAVSEVVEDEKRPFLILGSSDLTHYEPQKQASVKDLKLLSKAQEMDTPAFYTVLEREDVTSCGYGAIATAMEIAKKDGKKQGKLLKYATSGDVTGDKSSVVGYPSVHFV